MTKQLEACLALVLCVSPLLAAGPAPPEPVDLTQPGLAAKLLTDGKVLGSTFNLGPTGMRGHVSCRSNGTTGDVCQILVTLVDQGSPADGIIVAGDVILGVEGKPFGRDARKAFGWAIDRAEGEQQKGLLSLLLWRDGKQQSVKLQLEVLGSYSATAPYDCPKSTKILENGCRYLSDVDRWGRFEFGALALLASGKPEYEAIVRQWALTKVGSSDASEFIEKINASDRFYAGRGWNAGYGTLVWMEYYRATGDESVLPYVRALALNTARGGSLYGTYGHAMAMPTPSGELHGLMPPYGPVNQSGLACFLSMAIARRAGIQDAQLDASIARTSKFFGFCINKGNIPYGEHHPLPRTAADNNGTSGLAALAFLIEGDRGEMAQFWGKMSTAGYGTREDGHSGPFFGYMWGTPGANVAGPKAAAAYFKEVSWHYDLERRWNGSFAYTERGGNHVKWSHDYRGASPTAIHMLTYALPLRKLSVTGRDADDELWLSEREADDVIAVGQFDLSSRDTEAVLGLLRSWLPGMRIAAGKALAGRDDAVLPRIIELSRSPSQNAREGACRALIYQGRRAVPAVPALITLLSDDSHWIRGLAALALLNIGEPARPAVPALLKALAEDDEADVLRVQQDSIAEALFRPSGWAGEDKPGLLSTSLEGVDRKLLYPGVRNLIKRVAISRRWDARMSLQAVYNLLTVDDVKILSPDIFESLSPIETGNNAFTTQKTGYGSMPLAVELFAKHRIREGLPLALDLYRWPCDRDIDRQIASATSALEAYGGSAASILPELRAMQDSLEGKPESEKRFQAVSALILLIENDAKAVKALRLQEL
jgi:hypothetical protein